MGGASDAQYQLQAEQMQFYQTAINESATAFSEQQALQAELEGIYKPILDAGPNQYGFSDAETNALDAQAVQGTATNYEKAATALNEKLSSQGGGEYSPSPTGAQEELEGELLSSAARTESGEELSIKEAGYQEGHNEFERATQVFENIEGSLSPTAYSGAATNAGVAAGNTANEITQANNSWVNAAIGAVGSLGGAVIGENPGGVFGP